MKKLILIILILTALVAVGASGAYVLSKADNSREVQNQAVPQPIKLSKYEVGPPTRQELLELVNVERAKVGVAPLQEDPILDTSAQQKANDMAKYNYYDHVSPHDGKHGYQYIFERTDDCKYASENLQDLTNFRDTSYDVIYDGGWTDSKPHYKAMVDPKYDYIGFAHKGHYTVAHFCDAR